MKHVLLDILCSTPYLFSMTSGSARENNVVGNILTAGNYVANFVEEQ